MYEFFKGQLVDIESDALAIEVGGVGYHVITANPYRFTPLIKQAITIWLYLAVSQDNLRLYGFKTKEEKELFLELISVSGIGPRSALSILSLDDHAGLIQAITSGDIKFLTKFPGVGKKTAQQMILDLADRLVNEETETAKGISIEAAPATTEEPTFMSELTDALTSLGYTARQIDRVKEKADFTGVETTAEAIRVALHFMTVN
ncbi:MAG: Holliday junction branch migration protein RuvA [Aerococcus sp.]|nr:Holliday junction branch migration protein RuvA [Aerococcus sp.]